MALQPTLPYMLLMFQSTIVEIVMALQPMSLQQESITIYNSRNCYGFIAIQGDIRDDRIYNSRNCYGFIAHFDGYSGVSESTIVEIVMALQPFKGYLSDLGDLQQQKLLWLYSLPLLRISTGTKSTIVEIVMALQPGFRYASKYINLQQQKLLWLYSHVP